MDNKQQEEILMDLMNRMYQNTMEITDVKTNIEDIIAGNDTLGFTIDATRSKFDELETQIRTLVALLRLNYREIYKDKYLVIDLHSENKQYIGKFKDIYIVEGAHYGLDRIMSIKGDYSEYLFAGSDTYHLNITTFDDPDSAKLYAECAD